MLLVISVISITIIDTVQKAKFVTIDYQLISDTDLMVRYLNQCSDVLIGGLERYISIKCRQVFR